MLFQKQGFPEEGELVLCTVTNVQYNSVFAKLDDYGKTGMIHISEVSPGRIRNIRDYVVEGRKIVCKVLRIHHDRGHIDLSLRRVTEREKKEKMSSVKLEQKAEKIVELVAKDKKKDFPSLYRSIMSQIGKDYESLSHLFEDIVVDKVNLEDYIDDKDIAKPLVELVKQRIKPPEVEIKGKMKITLYDPNGVEIIKKALIAGKSVDDDKIHITYEGGGMYRLRIKSPDFKEAESILKTSTEKMSSLIEKAGGTYEFNRTEA